MLKDRYELRSQRGQHRQTFLPMLQAHMTVLNKCISKLAVMHVYPVEY